MIAPLKSLSVTGAGWVVCSVGTPVVPEGLPLVLPPDCAAFQSVGPQYRSHSSGSLFSLEAFFCERVTLELEEVFRVKLYRTNSEYERSETFPNVL